MSPTLRDLDGLRSDELALELGLPILEEHRDYFFEVLPQLIDAGTLGMRAWPSGDIAHEQTRIGIPLDDCGKGAHEDQGSAGFDG